MRKVIVLLFFISSIVIKAQTKFGVLVNGKMNINTKIEVAKSLNVSYIRDAIIMQNWDGHDQSCDRYIAAGFKIILNVNWGHVQKENGIKSPVPYPTDTMEYKKIMNEILSKYSPELVVIENEETIKNYHTGPIENYINELSAAITVAHSKGLKITNGGLTNRELALFVYNDYLQKGMKNEANDFANRCVKPALLRAGNPDIEKLVSDSKKLIEAYKRLPLDYVNIHIYEPVKNMVLGTDERAKQITPHSIQEIIQYIERVTGKKVVSNEVGERSHSPELVAQMMDEFTKANMEYCIWFSGDGEGGSVALQNEDGSLRPNGMVFKNFIEEHKNK